MTIGFLYFGGKEDTIRLRRSGVVASDADVVREAREAGMKAYPDAVQN